MRLGQLGQDLLRAALQVVHGLPDLVMGLRARPAGRQQAEQRARERPRADSGQDQKADAVLLVTVRHVWMIIFPQIAASGEPPRSFLGV